MPRPWFARRLACLMLVAAGFSGPAWELGHAWRHLHQAEEAHHAATMPEGAGYAAAGIEGHDHPYFQAAARPVGDLAPAAYALASRADRFVPASVVLRTRGSPFHFARAGPGAHRPAQPRAPPLL